MGSGSKSSRSSKSKAPAPLSFAGLTSGTSSNRHDSFGSDYSSNYQETPTSYTSDWMIGDYKGKSPEEGTPPSRKSSASSSKSSKPTSPTANVYTHCGRHSDQWLLGGRSMSDLFRSATKK